MSLSFAGVPLIPADSNQIDFIEANISYTDIPIFTQRAFPGKNLTGLTIPTGFYPMKPVRVNRLYWYTGASRWGYGHFLCDSDQLADIHAAVYGTDGKSFSKQSLIMNGSANGDIIQPKMFLAYETPLSPFRGGALAGLYLITLVDQRYYWWNIPCPNFGIFDPCSVLEATSSSGSSTPAVVTWEDLYESIEDAIGQSISYDEIDPVYLYPHTSLNLKNEALPLVFDAIAYNVGQRVTLGLDDKIRVNNFDTDKETLDNNFESHSTNLRAGGIRYGGVL